MTRTGSLTAVLFLLLLAAYASFQYGRVTGGPHPDPYEDGDERLFLDVSTHAFLGSPYPRTSMSEYAGVDGFYMRVPPLFTRLCGRLFHWTGPSLRTARLVSLGFSLATLLGLFLWSRSLLPSPWPLLPPLLACAVPAFQLLSRTAVLDMTYTGFSLATLIAYDRYARRPTPPALLLFGAAAGLALATKQLAVVLILALWAHRFFRTSRRESDRLCLSLPVLGHFALMSITAAGMFLLIAPAFLGRPLLAVKQLVWMELITKVVWAVKGARFPRPDAFLPLDTLFFLCGFAALALCRIRRRPLPSFVPLVALAFAPGFLFPNAAHYTLSLIPPLALAVSCAIAPPRPQAPEGAALASGA